jgi:hypothetical protein
MSQSIYAPLSKYKESGFLPRMAPADSLESADFPSPDAYRALLDDPECILFIKERLLLMWWQREFIAKWFPDYDPASYIRADEQPSDVDHILSRENESPARNDKEPEYVKWRDCIGNLRVWPKGENRRDQNNCHTPSYCLIKAPYRLTHLCVMSHARLVVWRRSGMLPSLCPRHGARSMTGA